MNTPPDTRLLNDLAPSQSRVSRSRCEAGFTLIELLVVMVIVAILIGLAHTSYTSAHRAKAIKQTIELAQTYSEAVDQFMLDHGGRTPDFSSPTDWPAPKELGPVSILSKAGPTGGTAPDPYIRAAQNMQEYVGTGTKYIADLTGTDSPGAASTQGHIVYLKTSDTTYMIKVYAYAKYVCSLGNDSTLVASSTPTCQ